MDPHFCSSLSIVALTEDNDVATIKPASQSRTGSDGHTQEDSPNVDHLHQWQEASGFGDQAVALEIAQIETQDDDGYDSGYDAQGFRSSATTSLASSIRKYRRENGRTYHAYRDGMYAIPNDEIENERLDLQNHLFSMSFEGKLYFSPLTTVHNCLDVGTGTGIWAMDFADEHPEAQVIGIDLSPIQPSMVPPNLRFVIDDAEDTWNYNEKFDFIHERTLVGAIQNWPQFMARSYDQLVPGGYLELQDVVLLTSDDGSFIVDPPSCDLALWWKSVLDGFRVLGRDMDAGLHHKERMIAAGFQDVVELSWRWPLNTWPRNKKEKELGLWSRENTLDGLEGIAMAVMTRVLGWSEPEVQLLLQGARIDTRNTNIHAYWEIRTCYGRKPFTRA